jgi:hypothetical protein
VATDVSVFLTTISVEPSGGDWGRCPTVGSPVSSALCAVGDIAPGQAITLTLPVRAFSDQTAVEQAGSVQVRMGVYRYPTVTFGVSVA